MKHVRVLEKLNWWNFSCDCTISWVPTGNCFWHYFRQLFILTLAFRKCKKDFNMLNIILLKDFCPLKTEIILIYISWPKQILQGQGSCKYAPSTAKWRNEEKWSHHYGNQTSILVTKDEMQVTLATISVTNLSPY